MIRILGIDPGSINTGFGIVDTEGNHSRQIDHGLINIKGETLAEKLKVIHEGITAVIDEFKPQEVSIERVFMDKNADSALKLGQARGAAICRCSRCTGHRSLPCSL